MRKHGLAVDEEALADSLFTLMSNPCHLDTNR
jgi:hypothetical protein